MLLALKMLQPLFCVIGLHPQRGIKVLYTEMKSEAIRRTRVV
jgi:hypothetical protein